MTLEDHLHVVWKDDQDSFIIIEGVTFTNRALCIRCWSNVVVGLGSSVLETIASQPFICTSLLSCLLLGAVHS